MVGPAHRGGQIRWRGSARTAAGRVVLCRRRCAPNDTYTLSARVPLKEITAIRLEALPDPRLANNGPGRASDGNFILSGFKVIQGRKSEGTPRDVEFESARATFEQDKYGIAGAIDGKDDTGWAIRPPWAGLSRRRFIRSADRGWPDFDSPGTKA